jgi:hypothetical protein
MTLTLIALCGFPIMLITTVITKIQLDKRAKMYYTKGAYSEVVVHYAMVKPVGSWEREGCKHYALWRRQLYIWPIYINVGKEFWLDMEGMTKV